jgi:hypothetical protein
MEKRIVKMVISIDIETNKPIDEIVKGLKRGIYRGLDAEPYYIAAPNEITINSCEERE